MLGTLGSITKQPHEPTKLTIDAKGFSFRLLPAACDLQFGTVVSQSAIAQRY